MKSLQEKYNLVNTNTQENNTMSNQNATMNNNVKSVEIVVNLAMSVNGPGEAHLAEVRNTYKNTIIMGRSLSKVCFKEADNSVFLSFLPLPESRIDKYGRNNAAVIIFVMEDGTRQILDAAQTDAFWGDVLNLEEGDNATDVNFSVIADIPEYDRYEVTELVDQNTARAVYIKFDGMPQFSTLISAYNLNEPKAILRPVGAKVEFSRTTIGDEPSVITVNNCAKVLAASSNSFEAKFSGSQCLKETVSSKRREARKAKFAGNKVQAQVEAARQDVVEEELKMDFGSPATSSIRDAEKELVAPAQEIAVAPVVDAEKEALRKENAQLKAEIKGLKQTIEDNAKQHKSDMDELKAMMAQIMASQSQAVPAPVVEEVVEVEEPVEESVEEESVEEAPKETAAEAMRRKLRAQKAKSIEEQTASQLAAQGEEEEVEFNFYSDDE